MPLPSLRDLRRAYQVGVGSARQDADARDGSRYDVWGGVGAMLWLREAYRDQGIFACGYMTGAHGDALDEYMQRRFQGAYPRVQATRGQGTATLSRATGGSDTIWGGTRIAVVVPGSGVRMFRVAADVVLHAETALQVPIESEDLGASGALTIQSPDAILRLEDPLADSSWVISAISCSAGTDYETDEAWIARVMATLDAIRPGYATAIVNACQAAGAVSVVLFDSRWPYDTDAADDGLNRVYVGDGSYNSTDAMVTACRFAMDSVAIAGIDVQTLGMQTSALTINVAVQLWSDVRDIDTDAVKTAIRGQIQDYLRSHAWYWRLDALQACAHREAKDAQSVVVTTSRAEPAASTLLAAAKLTRYTVADNDIVVTITGQ